MTRRNAFPILGAWLIPQRLSGMSDTSSAQEVPVVIRGCTVQIAVSPKIENPRSYRFVKNSVKLGTGFLVGDFRHVVTARHVTEAVRQQGAEWAGAIQAAGIREPSFGVTIQVGFQLGNIETRKGNTFAGNTVPIEADEIAVDPEHDISVLRLKFDARNAKPPNVMIDGKPLDLPLRIMTARLNPDRPKEGQAVGTSGYPLDTSSLTSTWGKIANTWYVESDPAHRGTYFLCDMQVNPGNSGGPVFLESSGEVIGIVRAFETAQTVLGQDGNHARGTDANGKPTYLSENSRLTVVVPIHYATELMSKNGIAWQVVATSPAKKR